MKIKTSAAVKAHSMGPELFTRAKGERTRIVRTVMELIRRGGWTEVSPARVAQAAGMDEAALRRIFPDAQSLWSAIFTRVHDRLMQRLEHAAASADDPLDALRRVFHSHVAYVTYNPIFRQLLLAVSHTTDSALRRQVREVTQGYEASLLILVGNAKAKGLLQDRVDPGAAVLFFRAMIHTFVHRVLVSGGSGDIAGDAETMFSIYRDEIRAEDESYDFIPKLSPYPTFAY
ncbi:MAG: TetR/AcrR family transcriptional regulator [Gammaproteobacteria bacterium]|nr:MAG: TetR/AcrR family transcriptional regulator [Gammaproteobacteria bacterium]